MGNCTVSFEAKRSFLPIEDRGVKLEVVKDVLKALNDSHKAIAREKLSRNASPGEVVVHGYVKELAQSESLSEHLARNPLSSALVGKCNVFLSHTWGSPFEDTVAALEEYENQLPPGSPQCFYFIDLFAINQFDAANDLDKLGNTVQCCKTLVLLAKPWHQPQTLSRAWCIFELAHAVLGNTELHLIMSAKEKAEFKDAMVRRLYSGAETERFMEIFTKIDSRNMKATKAEDLQTIEKFMLEKLGGFDKVDLIVSSGLRTWVGKTAVNLCDSFIPGGTLKHAKFLRCAGRLLYRIGMHEDFLVVSTKSRRICEDQDNEAGVMISLSAEAVALNELGKYDEAVRLLKELLEKNINKYGESHEHTLASRRNLGTTYMDMKMWDEAEEQLTVALKVSKELQRPMSVAIRVGQLKLARTLRDSGKDIERAQALCKEVLDFEIKAFGPDIPSVLDREVNYARCLALKGMHSRALTHYRRAWPVLLKSYGETDYLVKELREWIKEAEQPLPEEKE